MGSIEYSYQDVIFDITVGEDFVGQITWINEDTGQPIVFKSPCKMDMQSPDGEYITFRSGVLPSLPRVALSPANGIFQFTAPGAETSKWSPGIYDAVLWAYYALPIAEEDVTASTKQKIVVCRGKVNVLPTLT